MLSLHSFSTVGEGVDDCKVIELANVIVSVCLECFKHDPLFWKLPTHFCPFHCTHLQHLPWIIARSLREPLSK